MTLLLEEHHDLPLASLQVVFRAGAALDPEGREGLGRHAAELMRRGTNTRARGELDLALDALGASLEPEVAHDSVVMSLHCLSRHLDAAVRILDDILRAPRFAADEHEKLRRESLALLDDARDDDGTLAGRFFDRYALAGHAYGRSIVGTTASLGALELPEVVAWSGQHLTHGFLALSGDVDLAHAQAIAYRLGFANAVATTPPPAPTFRRGQRLALVDKPERTQSHIILGHPGPAPRDPQQLALAVALTAFGGSFTSRLMTEVRVKRGWSYSASAGLARTRAGHTVRIRTMPAAEQTKDTLELVLSLWREFARDGLRQDELDFAKSYLEGRWAFEIDTADDRLEQRIDAVIMDLPADAPATFVPRLRALTLDQVNEAVHAWVRPDDTTIIVTATAEDLAAEIDGLVDAKLEVVAYDSY